ncbi:MAG: Macrolide export ATP-binding/permease protein MacB [Planctomycetota bacterium]|jgi:putative ABC transport system permease protein
MNLRRWSAQAPSHRGLVVAAVALAIALVVFATGSHHAVGARSIALAAEVLGPWDLVVRPQIALRPTLSPGLEDALRADPAVARVVRTRSVWVDIEDAKDTTYYDAWPAQVIALDGERSLTRLAAGRWPADATAAGIVEGVLSGGLAREWRVEVGDRLPMHAPGGTVEFQVVGITGERIAHPDASGVFTTPATVLRLTGSRTPIDRLCIDLAIGADPVAVLAGWRDRLETADPPAEMKDLTGFAREIGSDGAFRRLLMLGIAGAALALVSALFIVATAMAAGADARSRDLALLRTVGATRSQVGRLMLAEALHLLLRASIAGVPVGLLLLVGLGLADRDLFGGPLPPHPPSLLLALAIIAIGVLVAAAHAAWRAARSAPLAALRAAAAPAPAVGSPWRWALAAASAAGVAWVAGRPWTAAQVGGTAAALLDLIAIVAAGCLALPVLVWASARWLGPGLGALAGIPGGLLRQQEAAGRRRAVGISATLAVCLGGSVLLNAWGRSMVIPFLPSPELPDQVISIMPSGLPPDRAAELGAIPGIDAGRTVPLRVEQTFLGRALMARSGGDPDAFTVQILGCDPAALGESGSGVPVPVASEVPVADLAAALRAPLACLVPPTLAERFGLKVGDDLPVLHASDGSEVRLRIAGIAALPGWQWISKLGRMRSLGDKPIAALLVGPDTATALGIGRVRHWLAATTPDADPQAIRRALQGLAEAHADPDAMVQAGGFAITRPSVKLIGTGEIARRMQARSDSVIWVLGALPLATLALALLGVAAAVSAGIRARRAEWAVLRATGMTAGQLHRLVAVEVLVPVAAATVVSVAAGVAAAQAALAASVQAFGTGTAPPPLIVPWADLGIAVGITAAVAVLAAWFPARHLSRTPPVALLREGIGT